MAFEESIRRLSIMAEARVGSTDTESSYSGRTDINKYGLAFDEITEEHIQEGQDRKRQPKDKKDALCDFCLVQILITSSKDLAFYLCYVCERYMCGNCFKGHDESHECINLVSEKSERETRRRGFLGNMRKERKREEKFEREKVSMVDRVNVKYGLDQKDCDINGICGLDNTRWVISDTINYCIKIFNVGTNLLQRYLRLGSYPWDVTEIKGKSESTEQGDMSAVDISVTNQGMQDKQCLIAVTLPWKQRILIIDVTQNPAVITETINTEKQCWSIDFSEDHLFTLCGDGFGPDPLSIFVTSINGVEVKTINTDFQFSPFLSYLAVCSGRFYITDMRNRKVLCLNDEGKEVSHKTIEGSHPLGISVDPDTNHLYISYPLHNKVYRLDSGLERSEIIFELESVNSEWPWALCLHRDKLYVGHWKSSTTHRNCVTVLRVL